MSKFPSMRYSLCETEKIQEYQSVRHSHSELSLSMKHIFIWHQFEPPNMQKNIHSTASSIAYIERKLMVTKLHIYVFLYDLIIHGWIYSEQHEGRTENYLANNFQQSFFHGKIFRIICGTKRSDKNFFSSCALQRFRSFRSSLLHHIVFMLCNCACKFLDLQLRVM
jgi:hypothetical protein